MKKQVWSFLLAIFLLAVFHSCQKEYSFETGATPSEGSLQVEAGGDCLPKAVGGVYEAGVALVASDNYIEVQVNVTRPGYYTIYTDTANGISFRSQGFFNTPGLNTVRLSGRGTPVTSGITNFIVSYGSTFCNIGVPVLPAGASGPAAFTFTGAPGNCSGAIPNGTYGQGIALNSSNTVILNVDVTTIGVYNVTTTTNNGMTFSGSGALIATGPQAITLNGAGTPAAAGAFNIAIAAAAPNSCTFPVIVEEQAVFTANCSSAVVNGTYQKGAALDASHTIQLSVTVTTAGVYSISVPAVNGISFSGSGSFAAPGTYTITLTGAGTPAASGSFNHPFTVGGSSCSVSISVAS